MASFDVLTDQRVERCSTNVNSMSNESGKSLTFTVLEDCSCQHISDLGEGKPQHETKRCLIMKQTKKPSHTNTTKEKYEEGEALSPQSELS